MHLDVIAAIVSAVCAALSILGAFIAYWRSNLSRQARDEAIEKANEARRLVEAIERQAVSMKGIEAIMKGPELELLHNRGMLYTLKNRGDQTVTIEKMMNPPAIRPPFTSPCTVPPGGETQVQLVGSLQAPAPSVMELKIEGREDPVMVPVPPRT